MKKITQTTTIDKPLSRRTKLLAKKRKELVKVKRQISSKKLSLMKSKLSRQKAQKIRRTVSGIVKSLGIPQKRRVQRVVIPTLPAGYSYQQTIPQQLNTNPRAVVEGYNQEREVQKIKDALRSKGLSPRTRVILQRLMYIQNKGARDNAEMQRRVRERRIVSDAGSLLKAKNLFGKDSSNLNMLEVEGNILTAPNVFKEREDNHIMKTNRPNILQTSESGNNLKL